MNMEVCGKKSRTEMTFVLCKEYKLEIQLRIIYQNTCAIQFLRMQRPVLFKNKILNYKLMIRIRILILNIM